MRLCHGVTRDDVAVEQGLQPFFLMMIGAVVGEDFRIPGVRSLAPEDNRRKTRTAEDLVHQRELELSVTLSAEFGSEVTGPQSTIFHLGLELWNDLAVLRVGDVVGAAQHVIERFDLFADELLHPVQSGLKLVVVLEIPGHFNLPYLVVASCSSILNSCPRPRLYDARVGFSPISILEKPLVELTGG